MKKTIITLICLFIIYAIIVNTVPAVTQWDENFIKSLQAALKSLPVWLPCLIDSKLYALFISVPLIVGLIYFFRKSLIIDIILFMSAPAVAYALNSILKLIVQRPRPPMDLQIAIHPHSYSFVSNHTFITCTLWGLVIFYLLKYCQNRFWKYTGITIGVSWMGFVGLSRVWLGVHNPTDVIGGYLLAAILLFAYIKLINIIGGKC